MVDGRVVKSADFHLHAYPFDPLTAVWCWFEPHIRHVILAKFCGCGCAGWIFSGISRFFFFFFFFFFLFFFCHTFVCNESRKGNNKTITDTKYTLQAERQTLHRMHCAFNEFDIYVE